MELSKFRCAVCGNVASKRCSNCKMVVYCSIACQRFDWNTGHKFECRDFQLSVKGNSEQSASTLQRSKSLGSSLVPNILNQSKKVLFPYEEFMEFFYWGSPAIHPCGLKNCGNSCFANVVLQCLTHTKPLVAYLLEKDHRRKCRLSGWCFLCAFHLHVERARRSWQPFSPSNILSRLPHIGGNLSFGKQEDAHEFMRFAIDAMQSVFLEEFGGRKAVPPSTQEATPIQHIFGGHLQSQVRCSKCSNLSNQFENMMDLTVEIHKDAESLEECLDQYTAEECMDGENKYKCDRCNDYVKAWKRLTIVTAPNILTIALKRFQEGRLGKLNKRVIFPENLDLSPNMGEAGDDNDLFKLYAVIVHVDTLKASYFGHYICYIKDFSGNWYRINDSEVIDVDISEVLSQEAYMLLYSRIVARPTSLYPLESLNKEDHDLVKAEGKQYSPLQPLDCHKTTVSPAICADSGSLPTDNSSEIKVVRDKEESPSITISEGGKEDQDMVDSGASRKVLQKLQDVRVPSAAEETSCPNTPEGKFLVSDNEEKFKTCEGTSDEDEDMVESGASPDDGVSSAAEKFSYQRMLLSPCSFIDSSAEAVIPKPEGRSVDQGMHFSVKRTGHFLVTDIKGKTETCEGTADKSLLKSSNEDSVGTNGEIDYDASASSTASNSFEILPDNSSLSPEQAIHTVILKTDGATSGEKLEPLCLPLVFFVNTHVRRLADLVKFVMQWATSKCLRNESPRSRNSANEDT